MYIRVEIVAIYTFDLRARDHKSGVLSREWELRSSCFYHSAINLAPSPSQFREKNCPYEKYTDCLTLNLVSRSSRFSRAVHVSSRECCKILWKALIDCVALGNANNFSLVKPPFNYTAVLRNRTTCYNFSNDSSIFFQSVFKYHYQYRWIMISIVVHVVKNVGRFIGEKRNSSVLLCKVSDSVCRIIFDANKFDARLNVSIPKMTRIIRIEMLRDKVLDLIRNFRRFSYIRCNKIEYQFSIQLITILLQ